MYGLPKNIDLSFLLEKELIQACFGCNDLILNFHESFAISISSNCNYFNGEEVVNIEDYALHASLICKLLGNKIVEVKPKNEGDLVLKFSNGDIFVVFDEYPNYESYIISSPEIKIIV